MRVRINGLTLVTTNGWNTNSDWSSRVCAANDGEGREFPIELVEEHCLGPGTKPGMAANMEDVFNPAHTYKYAAPGPQLFNGTRGSNYQLWVPDVSPNCASTKGQYYSSLKDCPVRWVIWSMGPKPDGAQSQDEHAPMARQSRYRRTGQGGIIARFQTCAGVQFKSP